MSERNLQFRVGLFVIGALVLGAVLVFQFGSFRWRWGDSYTVTVRFEKAPGVQIGTPALKNGVAIGSVQKVAFDEQRGGVSVIVDIRKHHVLRKDCDARLVLSFLGDATIDFTPGRSPERLVAGAELDGIEPVDPMQLVQQLEAKTSATLESFAETSREWGRLAQNVNSLLETNRGNLNDVVDRAAESLHQFSTTMRHANSLLGDPENQQNIKAAMSALPLLVRDTRGVIVAIRTAVETAEKNLRNLDAMTAPLAAHSESIAAKLDGSASNLELLLVELNRMARFISAEDGSLKMLASDPELYRNLNRSASTLDTLLRNLVPITQDVRVLSDKLARHPELLGVGGALRGSSGVKMDEGAGQIQPTSGTMSRKPSPGLR